MQEIQPQIAEIQKKYKKSPEIANQEIIKLYRKHNVNPMSGCLPILVQMPIIIALFQALRLFEYTNVGAAFFWVPHLKDPDPYFILPLLVGIATYLQTKLSMMSMPKTTQSNPQAEKICQYPENYALCYADYDWLDEYSISVGTLFILDFLQSYRNNTANVC